MQKGKFITFEGCDGSGKSTQASLLYDNLKRHGYKVLLTREPGGTQIAEEIRSILRKHEKLDPISDVLLIFAARRDHFVKLILPALNDGTNVICDRFYDSSIVYQGGLKGVNIQDILTIKNISIGNEFEPDLTILLDMPYSKVKSRINARGIACNDQYDAYKEEYDRISEMQYTKMRNIYIELSKIYSDRYVVKKGSAPIQKLSEDILQSVEEHILDISMKRHL